MPAKRKQKPAKKPAPKSAKKPAKKPAKPKTPELRLRSIRSVIYKVGDLAIAKAFYRVLLDREPYFDQPFYCGFDVDGQELGLDPDTTERSPGPGGGVGYWRVDDIRATWDHALALGARAISAPLNVGGTVEVATIADPFGNLIGLITGA